MRCRIAELIVEIPTAGGLAPRCQAYHWEGVGPADITVRAECYRAEDWPGLSPEGVAYMDSGLQFYIDLLYFDGLMLHASAVELGGRAYLFSGPCGVGKSTHTRLWQQYFGSSARVFNDDKPALRRIGSCWNAYGTPWCGKDGININMYAPIAGICFLKQGQSNRIRRLTGREAIVSLLKQTQYKLYPNEMNYLLDLLDKLVQEIPIFEMENRPEPEAVQLSYETMRRTAEEEGL